MQLIVIRSLLRLLAFLPLPVNHALGSLIGRIIYLMPNRIKKITCINLSLCLPELSDNERKKLAMTSLIETGKTVTELGPVWYWDKQRILRQIRSVQNPELAQDALSKGKGMILLTPHLGCWEIAGLHLASQYPMTSLYRPPRIQSLEKLTRKARERTGATLVPTNTSGVKALFAALARNETIGILPDQDPGGDGGIFVSFFGISTNTIKLASRLTQKTGAPVLLLYAERLPYGGGYSIYFRKPEEEIYSPDLTVSTAAMNRAIETCIRELPTQYQWSYKRFKRRPPGEPSPYDLRQ